MATLQSSPVERIGKTLRRYRFLIASLVACLAGAALVLYSSSAPGATRAQTMARDGGLALFTAGLVAVAVEYRTRDRSLQDSARTPAISPGAPDAWTAQLSSLATGIQGLKEQLAISKTFSDLGIISIHRSRAEIDLNRMLSSAQPGTEIRLMGVSLRTFSSADWEMMLKQKLREGCKVKILTLNPNCESAKQRALQEQRSYQWLKREIESARSMYDDLFLDLQDGLDENAKANFQLAEYDFAPSHFMVCVNDRMVVSPYLFGVRGYDCPHLELEMKEGGISKNYLDHFEFLWDLRRDVFQPDRELH